MFIESFKITPKIYYSDDECDFLTIEVKIGDYEISDSDASTFLHALDYPVYDLINRLETQKKIKSTVKKFFFKMKSSYLWKLFEKWNADNFIKSSSLSLDNRSQFVLSNQVIDPSNFIVTPRFPNSFFYSFGHGYIFLDDESINAKIVFKRFNETLITEKYVNFENFISEWRKLQKFIEIRYRYKHRQKFERMRSVYGSDFFIDLDAEKCNKVKKRALELLFKFYIDNNLLTGDFVVGDKIAYKNLTEIGWALKETEVDTWLNSKSVKGGVPNLDALNFELVKLRKLLE